jgi:sec-independent protein translocase protein TatA
MSALEPWHLILLLAAALIILGPKRLPEAGAALGKAVKDFRAAIDGVEPKTRSDAGDTKSGAR